MRIRFPAASALAAALSSVAACSASPTVPPVVINTPAIIESVTIANARAEADQDIQVAASVKDDETPLDRLAYAWSATPHNGSFAGNGSTVTWRPPKGQITPDVYTITLTVTEAFTSAGQPKQNRVSSGATVHYNDSPAELSFLAIDFLEDKFGDFNVSPAQAVSNFSDNCSGKAAELKDITINRDKFHILSASYSVDSIVFQDEMKSATVRGQCVFEDIDLTLKLRERVTGICTLTNVYENFKWFLCSSTFRSTSKTPLAIQPGRVPGRVIASE